MMDEFRITDNADVMVSEVFRNHTIIVSSQQPIFINHGNIYILISSTVADFFRASYEAW